MGTIKDAYKNHMEQSALVGVYDTLKHKLEREASKIYPDVYALFNGDVTLECLGESRFEQIIDLIKVTIKLQKVLTDANIEEYFIRSIYSDDCNLWLLSQEINDKGLFAIKLVEFQYNMSIPVDVLNTKELTNIVHEYRREKYMDCNKALFCTYINTVREIFGSLNDRLYNSSIKDLIEMYIVHTYENVEEKDILNISKNIMVLMLESQTFDVYSLKRLLFSSLNVLRRKKVFKGDCKVLECISTRVANAYSALLDIE